MTKKEASKMFYKLLTRKSRMINLKEWPLDKREFFNVSIKLHKFCDLDTLLHAQQFKNPIKFISDTVASYDLQFNNVNIEFIDYYKENSKKKIYQIHLVNEFDTISVYFNSNVIRKINIFSKDLQVNLY